MQLASGPLRSNLVSHDRVFLFLLYVKMIRPRCSKITSLRVLSAKASSSSRRPRYPLSSRHPSFTRNLATITSNRPPPRQLYNRLNPKSLMMDLESEIFNYTTGRFLYVSYILSRLCLTRIAAAATTYSVPMRPITFESAGASSISLDSSKSLLRQ